MKVLVVSNMYPNEEHPTNGIFVHEQVQALRRLGHDVRVASGKPLWLSGRHPARAARIVRAEKNQRRKPWSWTSFDGVPCHYFHYFAGAAARPAIYPLIYKNALLARLPELRKSFEYDLVHTHTAFLDGKAGVAAARYGRVPMVLTEHTGPFSAVTEPFGFRVHTKAALESADHIICVSAALRSEMLRLIPTLDENTIRVIPNGVDTGFFDPDAAALAVDSLDLDLSSFQASDRRVPLEAFENFLRSLKHELLARAETPLDGTELAHVLARAVSRTADRLKDPERPDVPRPERVQSIGHAKIDVVDAGCSIRLLWIGHHVEVKRVDRLIDAFAIARRRLDSLRLTLVGSGPLEAAMRSRARELGLDRVVRFVRELPRSGIRRQLTEADALVISSETETFGVVGIEAMSMGLPVIATDCGGPREYLDSGLAGVLVGNTTEDLAVGMLRIGTHIKSFDKAAIRTRAIQKFDFGVVAGRISALYEQATAEFIEP